MQSKQELIERISKGRQDLPMETIELWVYYLLQLKGCSLQSVIAQSVDEDAWLAERGKGIGGSEIAAIAGRSPWNTAYQIWLNKTGQYEMLEKKAQSEQARWGNVLEETIAKEWAFRNNRQFINIPVILRDDEHEFMFANIDGFTLSDDRKIITGILEIKTTSTYNQDVWEFGPIPEYYLCQTTWYTGITGLDNFTIVCLVGGQRLFDYSFPVDTALLTELRAAAYDFWTENVQKLIEPEIKAGDTELLKAQADAIDVDAPTLILDDEATENLAQAYCNLRTKIKELEAVKDVCYAQLMQRLTTSRSALTRTHAIELQRSSRRSCNWEALAAGYPEAYEKCVQTKVSVSLRVT